MRDVLGVHFLSGHSVVSAAANELLSQDILCV